MYEDTTLNVVKDKQGNYNLFAGQKVRLEEGYSARDEVINKVEAFKINGKVESSVKYLDLW